MPETWFQSKGIKFWFRKEGAAAAEQPGSAESLLGRPWAVIPTLPGECKGEYYDPLWDRNVR